MAARKRSDDSDSDGEPQKRPSSLKLWFQEAWEGWPTSLALLVLLGGVYLAYRVVPTSEKSEAAFGTLLVVGVVGGALVTTGLPAWSLARSSVMRAVFVTFIALWAIAAGYPTLRVALG